MKRLEIVLMGHSPTLSELSAELQAHGHAVHHLPDQHALQAWSGIAGALLIEDGSLDLNEALPEISGYCVQLGLRVGFSPAQASELSRLELLCSHGSVSTRRLITREWLTADESGNGRMLRDKAVARLVELAALHVSRFSRDDRYLESLPTTEPAQSTRQRGLQAVDQLLFEHRLNQTAQPHLRNIAETPISIRLEQALLTFAERPALSVHGHSFSYRELHAHSVAIQRHVLPLLIEHRAADTPPVIGICLPKSVELYAGILAILRCGAVYLPLDPGQPLQRQQYILENAGAMLLLHDGAHPLAAAEFPALNISAMNVLEMSADLMPVRPDQDAPCMALYTSGTTGQPKGVSLSQRNLSHFTAWYAEYVSLNERSRVLQFSTLSFDSSIIDIFPTWLSGAELVVPDDDQRRDPLQLLGVLQQGITHAFLPPALLSILPLDQPLGLQHVMTGGDVCEPHVIAQLAGQCHFHNLYGPTEATVLVTACEFSSPGSNRTLGHPIANSQAWILDEQLQPVAEQTPGELYIVGPGVCLGYINNPELTAERYVRLHTPDGQSLRAYRTGDIAKWTADGVELIGRRDNQVKIRGFRVEPEEIEHCLRASQLYRQVAVVVDSQRRILAFLAQPHGSHDEQALRAHVQLLLPDYMHPAVYTLLPGMPFAGNGKIDRKALLDIPLSFTEQHDRRLPATEQEQALVELWAGLLELPPGDISTDESFFNLGGHSILLSRLLLGIRERFGRSIPINRFIEAPTVLTLASLIDSDGTSAHTISPQALRDASAQFQLATLPIGMLGDVHKVIVTGANGFLGVHIVEALLNWGATEIACLVREGPGQSAQQRFEHALRENRLDHLDLSRVKVYSADVTKPRLGLNDAVYERLDREFGALVHNAANVNHVQDYETLARDNVVPVFECLKLCEGRSKKVFNFVSTLSASSAVDAAGHVLEQPAAETPPIYIKNGYNLSKWVAERVLQRARDQGAWVNIYRPGNIAFNSVSGVCQPQKNRLMLMLKGSLQLGQVPKFDIAFDLMPVDFLARFIGFHASRYQPERAVFNLHNPEPLSWNGYVEAFREAGRQFELVSVAQWQTQLRRVDSHNALFGVLGFYLDGFEEDIGDISMIDYQNTLAGIRHMGAQYPQKTPALLRKGCDYLKDIDFI
ncbi:amino acid adenylation domain-containing protein/thioester reductase domain-containing protein [Pseudomonas syringae]|uniref:non-ribosomal peptide synthetase n=1 Tax=Pseudomonas syringae TaxID=317 RepID=UPI0008958F07|nr:non-ribosomal peptide synthetase [Pseudomonas syringae]SDX15356.1 amino acid adenylation domain-containing protein/thioester reductase domain-containing protein [Pseudomonas syringae]SFM31920.1 amino acid adenylation domain-containing protein/thioester reductase domain-containing protein [Pseudomonas syringae]